MASCGIRTYKSLHRIALHHGGKTKIIRKKGLPFILKPLKNRTGFFIGAVLFIFIISFLESFVWNVEIVGNERVSNTMITSFLESGNLKSGAMWSSIDRDKLEWDMMSEFEDISWVHINKTGTTARVEINETTEKPAEQNEDNLKGVKVFRKELQTVAYRQQSKISIADSKSYKRLVFFSAEIPLYIKIRQGDIEEESTKMLTIKNTVLPVGITAKTEKFLTSSSYDLSDKELLELAKKKLSYLEKKELDGYTIINKSPKYETDRDKCTVTCAYVVRESNVLK